MRLLWYVSRRSQPSTASPEVGMAFLISKWARMPMTSQVNGTKNGCIMKNFNKIFFAAVVAAFGLLSCSQELTPVEKPQGNLVTVNFDAEASITCPTKATLTTEDEKLFTSAWENEDVLSVKYTNDNKTAGATTSDVVSATWTTDHFEAQMPEYHGTWDYNVVYPAPDANSKVDFGSARTQKGNAYNSKYDLMKGGAIAEGADAGKTTDGKNIVFEMTRQTAVAYFHLTGTLDEEVVSAKLSVEGGNIASSLVMLLDHTDGFDLSTEDLSEITITFEEGTAPKASDFQLWFNVLPTMYTKMTLTVETANHTMTISRTAADMYEAGKLYTVVKEIPTDKWVSKAAYNGGDLVFDFKTVQPKGWPTSKDNATAGTYKYVVNGVDYSFIHGTGIYCAGTIPTSAYLMIANSSSLGLPAIMGYRLVKVVGTLNDTGSPSTKAQISITNGTDVVSGGTAQTWNTKGADYTYTLTDTEENTIYYLSVSSTAKCQMIKLVLSYEPATPSVPKCATPEIIVDNAGVVSITCETAGATIHYTVGENPADPTEADAIFSAVTLTDGQTIKAIAVAEGFKPSAVASKKYTTGGADIKTATLTKEDIVKLSKLAYTTEKTLTKDNFTWSLKAYKDQNARPWAQIKKDVGAYVKLSAPKPIKEVRLTITSATNSKGGVEDITKHTAYSGDIHLKTDDIAGNSDTNDVAKTSTVTNNISTLVPTGSTSELYIKVSAAARIWGIEVDY